LRQGELTVGMVGAPVEFDFSGEWDGLGKIAVFTCDGTRDVILDTEGKAVVPHEILTTPGMDVEVGVYAVREDGTTWPAPTPVCRIGRVKTGADPSGDESYPPTPSVGEQLQNQINSLGERVDKLEVGGNSVELDTTLTQSGMAADAKAVGDALDELEAKIGEVGSGGITEETDPTVPAWAKAATKPTYTAKEVGAMAADAPVVKTVNGAAPDGSGNVVVPSGTDGVSATHEWNGTVLTITSASGTSSADLKGDTGAKGDKGDPGAPGASGAPGADGKTPERGVDYWTEADKAEIVADVLTAIPDAEGASF
jgi:hypothetical protein